MKASEIVEKLRSVLLSADEVEQEVSEIEVNAEEVAEEVSEEPMEEMNSYVKREELESAISEVKAMYDALVSKMDDADNKEVPAELSEEEPDGPQTALESQVVEQEVELAAEEEAVEPLKHSPEAEVQSKERMIFSENRRKSTRDIVFDKMFG